MTICKDCGEDKPLHLLPDNTQVRCKECHAARQSRYDQKRDLVKRRAYKNTWLIQSNNERRGGPSLKAIAQEARDAGLRWCGRCKTTKPPEEFHSGAKGNRSYCRTCTNAYNVERRQIKGEHFRAREKINRRRPEALAYQRRRYLAERYDLTPEAYQELWDAHDGKCGICGDGFPITTRDLLVNGHRGVDIDHCHDSKRVRGLLCHQCNIGLGSFRDNPQALMNAARYIQRQLLPA